MARVKVTSSDIYARLARGECANYRNNACQGRTPCTIINGEACQYFNEYVKPLLDYPEFSNRYAREAKQTVALNPRSKVIRKRREATEPRLALEADQAPAAKPAVGKLPATRTARAVTKKRSTSAAPALPIEERKPRAAKTIPTPFPVKAVKTVSAAKSRAQAKAAPAKTLPRTALELVPETSHAAHPKRKRGTEKAITTTVRVDGAVVERPQARKSVKRPVAQATPIPPQLALELTPATVKPAGKRRTASR